MKMSEHIKMCEELLRVNGDLEILDGDGYAWSYINVAEAEEFHVTEWNFELGEKFFQLPYQR